MEPRVGTIELAPGPLADVTAPPAAALLDRLERERIASPRALVVVAPHGVGADEPRPPTPTGLQDPAAALAAFPAPTVAAWNGPAIGPGAELVLAADVRVLGRGATLSLPEVGAWRAPVLGRHATPHPGRRDLPRVAGAAAGRAGRCRCTRTRGHRRDRRRSRRSGARARAGARPWRAARRRQLATRCYAGSGITLADGLRLEADLNLLLATTHDRAEGIDGVLRQAPPGVLGRMTVHCARATASWSPAPSCPT